jgi:hypothetical protein
MRNWVAMFANTLSMHTIITSSIGKILFMEGQSTMGQIKFKRYLHRHIVKDNIPHGVGCIAHDNSWRQKGIIDQNISDSYILKSAASLGGTRRGLQRIV